MLNQYWKTQAGLWRSLLIYRANIRAQRRLERFCRTLVKPGDLVFDIGAHVGNRALAFAGAGARVVAFEPQPIFARHLERWVARPAITVRREAVGAAAGEGELVASRRHPTVSSLSADWVDEVGETAGFEHVAWDARHPVRLTTLDALIGEYGVPAFTKIDVEGFEPDVLAGLSTPLPALCFEYLPASQARTNACLDRLEALGRYRYNAMVGEDFAPVFEADRDATTLRAALPDLCRSGRSGDIYARLESG